MSSLQEQLLIHCTSLSQCPSGLGDLVSLQELVVESCFELRQLPDLHKLTNLRRLCIWLSKANFKVLGFNDSMLLQELVVSGIEELPELHLLRHLQRLSFITLEPSSMLRFGSFIALEEPIFGHLPEVQELPDMPELTRLRRLTIDYAPKMLRLLPLGDLVALQYLSLSHCCTLAGIAELPDLHNLTDLQVLELFQTPVKSLPSLKRLTQLRDLRCSFTLLAELPDLSGSKYLERIDLGGCHQLTSLGNLATSPALEYLNLATCYRLERLPDLRSSNSLGYLGLCHSGVRLSSKVIMILAALSTPFVFAWDHFQLHFSKMLEKMALTEVVMMMQANQMEYFATPQTMFWHFTHVCMHDMRVSAVGSINDRY